MKNRIIISILLLFLISCVQGKNYNQIKTELYFGLSNKYGVIPDSLWTNFQHKHIDKILGGYTIIEANGFWTGNNGNSVSEASKILVYVHKNSETETKKIDSIITLYKSKFQQESVLKIEQNVKFEF